MSNHKQVQTKYIDKCNQLLSNLPSYVKSYIRSIHNRTSARTNYEYVKDIQMFLSYIKDRFELSEVTLEDLEGLHKSVFEDYLEYLEHYENGKSEVTNERRSLSRKLSSLKAFFKYLYTEELIKTFEISKVPQPKIHKKEIIKMDQDEASQFMAAVHGRKPMTEKQRQYHDIQEKRDLAMILLMLSSGIRVSECSEIDIDDIDIQRDKTGRIYKACVYITRKGGNESTVYFSDEAAIALLDYMAWRNELKGVKDEEKALFLSSRKTRLSVRAIEVIVKKYTRSSLPGKHITPHKLRATFATQLYEKTGDIYLVAEALGHKDVSTTKNHYANLSNKRKEENRNQLSFNS